MTTNLFSTVLIAAAVLSPGTAFAQSDIQVRARELPGWDLRAREGRCEIRLWVDNRAEVSMRGDAIFIRTLEGSRAHDEGSACSQSIPYNSIGAFQVRQTAGRSRVSLAREPSRGNNYTATILIEDQQGGGDSYAFDVSWTAAADIGRAPAPFFDVVRACQDIVRRDFLGRNGRGSYIDFTGFAERQVQNDRGGRGRGQGKAGNGRGRSQDRETIQGRGIARKRNESRSLTYSCLIDNYENQVVSGAYQYSGDRLRTQDRPDDRRELK